MKVSVEIITGTFIDTEVRENATVKELKEKIATDVKLSVKRLILVVGDEDERRMVMEDEDEMMLRDLGVIEDSHMYLFFKHPDLVYKEERSHGGGDDASMEEISSDAESRGETEEEEKAKIDGEEEGKAMKTEEESRDAEVEGEKEKNGEEAKDAAVVDEKEEAKEGEDVEV